MCLHCISEGAEIWFTSLGHHKNGRNGGEKKEEVVESSNITLSSAGGELSFSGLFL